MRDPNEMTREQLVEIVELTESLMQELSSFVLYDGSYLDDDAQFRGLYNLLEEDKR